MRRIAIGLFFFLDSAATTLASQAPLVSTPNQGAAPAADNGLVFATWMLVAFTAALVLVTVVYTWFTREAVKEAKATRDVLAGVQDALTKLYTPTMELTIGVKRVSSHFHYFNELFSAIPHPDQLADILVLTLTNQADATTLQAEMVGAIAEYFAMQKKKPALVEEIRQFRSRLAQRIPVPIKLFSNETIIRTAGEGTRQQPGDGS